jgi:hypothetical protein
VNRSRSQSARRILVVDHEPNIADVLSIALRYNDYDVEVRPTDAMP